MARKRLSTGNFCTITTVEAMHIHISSQYLFNHIARRVIHCITDDDTTKVSLTLPLISTI